MWIKVHFNQIITFTGLEFSSFTIFDQKDVFKIFGKVKIIKSPAGFELMSCRFVVTA